MYKLIIVDDEETIRSGMSSFIDWNSMGFEVAADFEDGRETIDYLKEHEADVILTDIEMAEVNGLDLAAYVQKNHPEITVVILSGYREFEYARRAIEYNVNHYLLKPIRMDEIGKVFEKIRQQLDERTEKKKGEEETAGKLRRLLPELREQFWLSLLIGGSQDRQRISEKKELLGLHFREDCPCGILSVKLSLDADENQLYYQQRSNRYNLINNIFAGRPEACSCYPVYLGTDSLKVIAVSDVPIGTEDFSKLLDRTIEQIDSQVEMFLKLEMQIRTDHVFADFYALASHPYSSYIHTSGIRITDDGRLEISAEDTERLHTKYNMVMQLIDTGDFASLRDAAENLFFDLRRVPLAALRQIVVDLFSQVLGRFMKMSRELWEAERALIRYEKLMACQDVKALKELTIEMLGSMLQVMESQQSQVSRNVIEHVRSYIREHFAEDLSLDALADQFYLNPTYLSRIFREYAGETFTEYVISLRMKEAQRLLLSGRYKMYEVSSMVGYRSDKYFSKAFKQYTQMSPSEFLRSRREA